MKLRLVILCIIFVIGIPKILVAATIEEGITSPELKKAWDLIKTNHPIEALQYLPAIKSESSTAFYYHFVFGRLLEGLKRTGEALEHYRSAYFQAPSEELRALAFLERAEAYSRIHNYYEAKIIFSLFLKNFNKSKELYRANLGLAKCLTEIGYLNDALPYFDRAGDGSVAIFEKADTLHRLGRFEEAHQLYSKGMALDKLYFLSSPRHIFYYGENLQQLGKDQEALQYLTINTKDPAFKKKADLVLGRIALKDRKFDEAQKLFNSALSSPDIPTRQEALFSLGETYIATGNKSQARQAFQEYWAKYPAGKDYEEVLIKLSKIDLEEGRIEGSSQWIKELSFRSQLKEKTIKELEGFLLRLKDKDPLRIDFYWNFVRYKLLNPSREPFLLIMGEALKGKGKPYLELQQWLAKNGTEPVKRKSQMALVGLQIERGNLREAMDGIQSLKKQKVAGDDLLRLEAKFYHEKMDYRMTSDRLLALKKIEPGDLSLWQDTLLSARNVNASLAAFERNLLKLGGNAEAYIKLADAYHEQGKKKEALRYYQKALETDPLNEWALFRAGILMEGEEGKKMLGKIKNESSLLGKISKASLKEMEIQQKIGDSF